VLGVAGVLAMVTFSTSLDRLVDTPTRWGWPGELAVVDVRPEILDELAADERIAAIGVVSAVSSTIDGSAVQAYTLEDVEGSLDWTVVRGRLPRTGDEAALGTQLAERLDVGIGDRVRVGRQELEVVGEAVPPNVDGETLGEGVVVTGDGADAVGGSLPFTTAVVDLADGVDAAVVSDDLSSRYELTLGEPPADVANLADLGRLPTLLGAFLGAVGAVALGHALVVTVRRRSTDLAVLRALGFSPRQVAGALAAMATTTAVVGLVVGVPLGLAVGRLVWWAVAEAVGVATDPLVPVVATVLAVPATVAVAVAVAVVPARRAARAHPAALLRVE